MDRFLASFLEKTQTAPDIDRMVEAALEYVVCEFGFEEGALVLFAVAARRIYRYSAEEGGARGPGRLAFDDGVVAALREAFRDIDGPRTMREFLLEEAGPAGRLMHGSWLEERSGSVALPLRHRGENIGVIKLLGARGTPALDGERRGFLDLVGRQMGLELSREMALEREKSLAHERQLLQEVGRAITSGLDLDEVLGRIVAISSRRMGGISRVSVALFGDRMEVAAVFALDPDDPIPALLEAGELEADFLGEAAMQMVEERETVYVEDARTDPRANNEHAKAVGMVSALGVPILQKDRVTGFILIYEPGRRHRFSEEDVRVMEGIAAFAAIAIENARLYRESREQQERTADLMLRLARVREEERSRISRELHDSMAQTLLEIIYKAEALLGSGPDERLRRELEVMLASSRSSLSELRRIITDLRPSSVEVLGLTRALASLLDRFAVTYRVEVEQDLEEGLEPGSLYENSIYRMVQEALNNVSRHASASRVRVSLRRAGGRIRLEVSDDGAGFDPASAPHRGGLGLASMRERAETMGGSFEVESAPGRGTTIRVEVPPGRDPGPGKREGGA